MCVCAHLRALLGSGDPALGMGPAAARLGMCLTTPCGGRAEFIPF